MIDKNGSRKMNDGFDGTRDLISYSAKYDENKNILLKIKTEKYDREAFENDSSVVILMDFLKDNGSYLLPFNIRGATDHWWEVAYSIKNDKIITETSEDVPHLQNQELIKLKEINENEAETTIEIDTKKLKELGWCERFPLYIQI
ncbi:MAG: hypothetical protein RMJ17_01520, partial [Candidatus Aenigmarchaeota archaeon]|nr:hypothetical protein [Candidatus Aenigmarchaeota archaeon]MDW8149256.1 hypothetical protein [Candidatus Aenigmarchaeota archaeon]